MTLKKRKPGRPKGSKSKPKGVHCSVPKQLNVYERIEKLEAKIKRLAKLEKSVDVLYFQVFGRGK